MVCMSNGVHEMALCFSIFRKTCDVIGLEIGNVDKFSEIFTSVEQAFLQNEKPATNYGQLLLQNMRKVKIIWESYFPLYETLLHVGCKTIKAKMERDKISSWPITDAEYIWYWLHIVTIDIDLNCGYTEKIAFIRFVSRLLGCSNCKSHYLKNQRGLEAALSKTTCTNAFLALHTHINANIIDPVNFVFTKDLVNSFYGDKFKQDFLKLKINLL